MDTHKRVLVIDNDPETARVMSSALAPHGLEVHPAADTEEALARLRDNSYAVVLLDVLLPGFAEGGVLEELGNTANQSPPVVLVLSAADESVTGGLDARLIHGVVRKPFDARDLASVVVACSEIRARGMFGTMAIATIVGGAPWLAWLVRS